jgi:Icc-related predicted phosphoesterase
VIRVAAVGDVHLHAAAASAFREGLAGIAGRADLLLLAGDLTRTGCPEEIAVVVTEVRRVPVPVVAVLGNHDHHDGRQDALAAGLREAGAPVLEGDAITLRVGDRTVGVAGVKGFGGGFLGASGAEFGEAETKAFMAHSRERARALEVALRGLEGRCDVRIALTHYAPVRDTVAGEPPELWPWLGTHLLAEAIDRGGAALAVHGHAHHGTPTGVTPGGVPVHNVAQPLIRAPYRVHHLDGVPGRPDGAAAAAG